MGTYEFSLMVVGIGFLVVYVGGVLRIWREQDAMVKPTPEQIKPKARAAGVR